MRDATLPDPALSSSPAPHGGSSKKRLRIAVLSRNFSTTGGGAERYSIAVVEGLARQHEVHVFAQTIAHAFPGVVYHRIALPMRKPRWINQLYFAWATWRLTRTGFDVVHAHENTWHGNVHTVHVLPIKHNLFNGLHGIAWALRWLRVLSSPRLLAYLWLEKRRYAFAYKKRIVCASSALKAIVQAAYPQTAPMLSVITPGITPELIQADGAMTQDQRNALRQAARQQLPLHVPATTALLLLVGNDFVKKGLPTMLAALAQLSTQFHLAVVGQSEHLLAMQRLAEQTGVAARVHFLGSLSHIDVAYRAADMLVHPTREDSYGMVVLEAMAHGLPVVVSAAPFCGIAEDLTDAVNAVLLQDPTDAPALAAAVQRIHGQPNLAQHLSAHATTFARQHTWKRAVEAHEALFHAL